MLRLRKKYVFLDIDGVLNDDNTTEKSPTGFTGIDDTLLQNLKDLIEETKAEIVLTSTWKEVIWPRPNRDGKLIYNIARRN